MLFQEEGAVKYLYILRHQTEKNCRKLKSSHIFIELQRSFYNHAKFKLDRYTLLNMVIYHDWAIFWDRGQSRSIWVISHSCHLIGMMIERLDAFVTGYIPNFCFLIGGTAMISMYVSLSLNSRRGRRLFNFTYPDAKWVPFGEKLRSRIQEPWPESVLICSSLWGSWILICVSSEPLSTSLESGVNATALTGRAWAPIWVALPVSMSNTWTRPATVPATNSLPSGLFRKAKRMVNF